jgi:hypothetical protein
LVVEVPPKTIVVRTLKRPGLRIKVPNNPEEPPRVVIELTLKRLCFEFVVGEFKPLCLPAPPFTYNPAMPLLSSSISSSVTAILRGVELLGYCCRDPEELEVCLHGRKFWDYYGENEELLWTEKTVWGFVYKIEAIICTLEAWVIWKTHHLCMWARRVEEFEEAKKNDPWCTCFCSRADGI